MESVEENLVDMPIADGVKSNTVENEGVAIAVAADLCQNSNGVAEIGKAGQSDTIAGGNDSIVPPADEVDQDQSPISNDKSDPIETGKHDASSDIITVDESEKTVVNESVREHQLEEQDIGEMDVSEVVTEVIIDDEVDRSVCHDVNVVEVNVVETSLDDAPKFKTEILIEANDNVVDTAEGTVNNEESHDTPNNIPSEFGENIELSEVLRSNDVVDASENNNSPVRQEVFNKEELLDILEGNDIESTSLPLSGEVKQVFMSPSQEIETKLALQQLSRLKREKRKYRGTLRMTKLKREKRDGADKKKVNHIETDNSTEKKADEDPLQRTASVDEVVMMEAESNIEKKQTSKDTAQADNIVNVLVMDWDDEELEPNELVPSKETVVDDGSKLNETEKPKKSLDVRVTPSKPSVRSSVDTVPTEEQTQRGKPGDENQPQRRLGRVIKKKVIFDPDNPDTFTKTKTKNREPIKDQNVKEQSPFKKGKHEQTPQRSKSKSPMSNLQWKKPTSKNSKQNRRLTEVDKLLMDEGAVNMIYQLTPEAPKGKKSRETKAEFIKKIQSSTPDGKEMKFRERKKESLKYEDGEAKKILGAKHRVSLNSSIKSPSVSEDFETHSADDSIIYRRHSSSSYSSSCMSPRRLSDVDSSSAQTTTRASQMSMDNQSQDTGNSEATDVFMSNAADKSNTEIINKDDYLSIKEKLNSKLSLALNKRKRDSIKNEKPQKLKKLTKTEVKEEIIAKGLLEDFKYVTVKTDQRVAEICIEKTGLQYNIEVLKEIEQALEFIDSIKDISVTLLTSECGTLCSNLDLSHIVEDDKIRRVNNALEVAETVRSLQIAVDKHSKLLCSRVHAACWGVGLALAALSDVVLASERATFSLTNQRQLHQPGAAALMARCRLPHSMVNDLILFGRQLSASEALRGGLVSRVLWPRRLAEQARALAQDMAAEPAQNVILRKQLIGLKKVGENEQTFLSCLDKERDIFVEYWTSVEGQELLRAFCSST